MSHFSVLVMGENMSDEDNIEKAMLPYHEFECTGDNRFTEVLDITEEARGDYESGSRDRYVLPTGESIPLSGEIVETWFRAATEDEIQLIKAGEFGKPHRVAHSKDGDKIYTVFELPAGVERKTFMFTDLQSFEEFAADYFGYETVNSEEEIDAEGSHKFGYILKDETGNVSVFRRTNPNAAWDWYTLGGRWSNMLLLKNGSRVDSAKKSDIDFYSMREQNIESRREAWNEMVKKLKEICEKHEFGSDEYPTDSDRLYLGKLRAEQTKLWKEAGKPGRLWDFMKQNIDPVIYDLMSAMFDYFSGLGEDHLNFDKIEDWIDDAPSIYTFAMNVEGAWISQGEMEWFGMSSNDMPADDWNKRIEKAIADLPDDHEIAVVDCHI